MRNEMVDERVTRGAGTVVMVLLVLLAACSSSGPTVAATTTSPSTTVAPTTTTSTTTTTLPPTTTTTTIPIITEGAVVLVANASDIDGAARQITAELEGLGFRTNKPTNAAGNEDKLDVSKVYFLPLGEAAAQSIALLMGGVAISKMPTPAWIIGGTEALGDTNVLVMLGSDLAGESLPGLAGR